MKKQFLAFSLGLSSLLAAAVANADERYINAGVEYYQFNSASDWHLMVIRVAIVKHRELFFLQPFKWVWTMSLLISGLQAFRLLIWEALKTIIPKQNLHLTSLRLLKKPVSSTV